MSTGKVVLGTVAGLAFGAIASILFAPEKGSSTRKLIRDKSDKYVDKLKSILDDFFDSLAQNFAEKGSAKYDDVKRDVKIGRASCRVTV